MIFLCVERKKGSVGAQPGMHMSVLITRKENIAVYKIVQVRQEDLLGAIRLANSTQSHKYIHYKQYCLLH